MFDIWSGNDELSKKIYKENNYKVIKNSQSNKKCVIYCSSNNIWYPNTKEKFIESFIKKDKFEWINYRVKNADKEIFIRDIYKSWYVTGINEEINCIDKLLTLLKNEISGYEEVISIGSSAGGYMAALIAACLNLSYCICFSAQYYLYDEKIININPLLQKYKNDISKRKYFDICNIIAMSKTKIFYFMPSKSKWDIFQMEKVEKIKNIKIIKIKSKRHGVPLLKCNIDWLINLDADNINNYFVDNCKKQVNPIILSFKIIGTNATIMYMINEFFRKIRKINNKRREKDKR